jgi:hypothetical protein
MEGGIYVKVKYFYKCNNGLMGCDPRMIASNLSNWYTNSNPLPPELKEYILWSCQVCLNKITCYLNINYLYLSCKMKLA